MNNSLYFLNIFNNYSKLNYNNNNKLHLHEYQITPNQKNSRILIPVQYNVIP